MISWRSRWWRQTPPRRLLGVITADDVIDVLQAEHANVVARMAGSDAAELEKKSPVSGGEAPLAVDHGDHVH